MGLRSLLDRILDRTRGDDTPPTSQFGPEPRAEAERRARAELLKEMEVQKGRIRGF